MTDTKIVAAPTGRGRRRVGAANFWLSRRRVRFSEIPPADRARAVAGTEGFDPPAPEIGERVELDGAVFEFAGLLPISPPAAVPLARLRPLDGSPGHSFARLDRLRRLPALAEGSATC
jgi:hypothetical protein